MIKVDITVKNYEANDKVKAYAADKMEALEKFIPRAARGTAHFHVVLEEDASGREANRFVCEAILTVPGERLMSRDGTLNMFAAIDIAEAKMKAQLRGYREKTGSHPRGAKAAIWRLFRREESRTSNKPKS